MIRVFYKGVAVVLFSALTMCNEQQKQEEKKPAPKAMTAKPAIPLKKKTGFDVSGMDTNVRPQDDFYQYAIGTWRKNNPVPEDQNRWTSFDALRDKTKEDVKKTILKAADVKSADPGSVEYKVGTFYKVAINAEKADADRLAPIQEEIDRIKAISTMEDMQKEMAHMMTYTSSPLFHMSVGPDEKNATMNIAGFYQGGIGLPDRDFYVEQDERSKEVRVKYLEHLNNMFKLMGYDDAQSKTNADAVMTMETRLAKASNTRTENRNPKALYNKMNQEKLATLTPKFNWNAFFVAMNVDNPGDVNINQPKFMKEVGKMMKDVPLEKWKIYLEWNLIRHMASALSSDFVNERFEFSDKFMNGQQVIQPRWKRAVDMTGRSLGEAVGQLYVKDNFPPEAKARANELVKNLLVAMGDRIDAITWMSPETKAKAREKLSTFYTKIGYPDKWKDLTELVVKDDSYAQNVMRANYFNFMYDAKKINKPVDKAEWWMNAQTVNASYDPPNNAITFPAGILQFPFFDNDVDDAINYGGIGAVIGHEITHGFDDEGRQYDKDGNLNDWWTKEDTAKFDARAKVLVEQYDKYSPIEGFNLNGKMTLGENIADLGGLTVAYQAFSKTDQYKKEEKIDGFTPAQRFFLAWAQIWRCNVRDQAQKTLVKTDVHSPGMFRVIGPLSNFDPFFKAFDVQPTDKMHNPTDNIVEIW